MEHHRAELARLADIRAQAVREALESGMTRAEIARALGITPAVITKLLARDASAQDGHE